MPWITRGYCHLIPSRRAISLLLAGLLLLGAATGCGRGTAEQADTDSAAGHNHETAAPAQPVPSQNGESDGQSRLSDEPEDAPADDVQPADQTDPTAADPADSAPAEEPPLPAEPALDGTLWVMISNVREAMPQSGLDKASWVYEIESEGGVTRFLAGFYHQAADKIGPIRSVRDYYLHIVKAYGGPIAHAGASYEALDMLARDRSYQDMDEIYNSGGYFWRSQDRKAPHNLYTSTEKLLAGVRAKKYRLQPLPEYPTGAMAGGEPAAGVKLSFPINYLQAEWKWENGRYLRSQNGTVHAMQDGAAIRADNILVLIASGYRSVKGDDGVWRREIGVTGEGEGYFFSGGRMWKGRWKKPKASEHFQFTVEGQPFLLAPGITWVEVLPGAKSMSVISS